jgi:hypothetical protein
MDDYKKEAMDMVIRLRMSKSDYSFIKQRAKNNHLTISDYLRRRGAEDPDVTDNQQIAQADNKGDLSKARFACDHDKELMRIAYSTYMFTRELLLIVHGGEVYQEVVKDVQLRLKEWGYEDE